MTLVRQGLKQNMLLTHAIESSSLGSGDANIHNLKSRLILEKSVGNRADIRGGSALGCVHQ